MTRGRKRSATLAVAVMALGSGSAHAARFDYTVDLGIERNDNLNLSPTDPIEETIYRPALGFSLTEDSDTLHANVAGRIEYRHYADGTYDSGIDGTLAGIVEWEAIPERLTLTAEDTVSLEPIDTFEVDSPDNRQQVNVFSIGPTLNFRMGSALDGQVELRFVDTNAEVTDEFNSSRVDLALRTIRRLDATSQVTLNLRGQSVDFDDEVTGRNYRRTDLFGSYAKRLHRFELGADVGFSRIDYTDGDDTRSEPLLRGEVAWIPSDSHRFNLALSRQFSDAATDAMARLDDGIAAPGSILTGDTVINASPYEERRAQLDYTFTSTVFTTSVETYADELDYVDSDEFDQEGVGGRGTLLWVINERTTAGAFVGVDKITYTQIDREDEVRRYGVSLSRTFTPHWSARLEFSRYERRTTLLNDDADQNTVFFVFRYTR